MLRRLFVKNFKPFREFSLRFSGFDILVGKNNMGKSTLLDVLRLISLEANYRLRRELETAPGRVFGEQLQGFRLEQDRIPFSVANVHHEYAATDTYAIAQFDGGVEIRIVFFAPPSDECFLFVRLRQVYLENLEAIRRALRGINMAVLPRTAPFEEREELLNRKYVQEWFGTSRSSMHFRNIWLHDRRGFDDFRTMLVETWPGSDVREPEQDYNLAAGTADVSMYFQEDRMTREIAWAGHGMQVWMQILTYLAKMKEFGTLVLDEPEIFLHSDIQRKLVGLLRSRAPQIIVATHSVDIINETPPLNVVVVDKRHRSGKRPESVEQLQRAVEGLGSIQNIQLLGLLRSRFVLFVEGDDRRLLRGFAEILGYENLFDAQTVSVVPLGGGANWRRLKDLDWIWKNALGERIRSFVLLDRDYSTDAQVADLARTLRRSHVGVHIWKKKEIENYLLVAPALRRCLLDGAASRSLPVSIASEPEIAVKVQELSDRYRAEVAGKLVANLLQERRPSREDPVTTITNFNRQFDNDWYNPSYRLSQVPGKDLLSDLSSWAQTNYGISISATKVMKHLDAVDVDREMGIVLRDILRRAGV